MARESVRVVAAGHPEVKLHEVVAVHVAAVGEAELMLDVNCARTPLEAVQQAGRCGRTG